MADKEYTTIAVGDIGTQLFWFNKTTSKFEYALPVTAGAEFGGDTESFEAPETDLDYVPKIGGRSSINDISYTINFTSEKYKRVLEITDNVKENIYMEVLNDGSAMIFKGVSGRPTLTAGDVRQITMTIIPSFQEFFGNIYELDVTSNPTETSILDSLKVGDFASSTFYTGTKINIDVSTIPTVRQKYSASNVEEA